MKKRLELFWLLLLTILSGGDLIGQACENHSIYITQDSLTELRLCPNDGISDFFSVSRIDSSVGTLFSYIVADVRDNIISVESDSILNFEGFDIGLCRIWGVAHGDSLIYSPGMDVISIRARNNACVVLSDNVINVIKEQPNGGTVQFPSGITDTTYCSLGALNSDTAITVVGSALSGLYYTYVLTNASNRVITNNNSGIFDLSGLNEGTFNIYGMSYAGLPQIQLPADSSIFGLTNDGTFCAELSANNVIIHKEIPDAGQIRANRVDTSVIICPEGGRTAKVRIRNTGSSTFDYTYLITDEIGQLLKTSQGDSVDFNGSESGICRIYGLSYDGNLSVTLGESIFDQELADVCFDISDEYITVHRIYPEAGSINSASGQSVFLTCPGDNLPDRLILSQVNSNDSIYDSRYVITDQEKIVMEIANINIIDFEGAEEGICYVYSLTYSGELLLSPGDTLGISKASTGCSDISDNFMEVKRFVPDGGVISDSQGNLALFICTDQEGSVTIDFQTNSNKPQQYEYVITNSGNRIVDILDTNSITFTDFPGGSSRVWGVAYTGSRLLQSGDNISFSSYSNGCFDFSDNFLQVVMDDVDAGEIFLDDGSQSRFFCLGRQENTVVEFSRFNSSNSKQQYVLTDGQDRIIQFLSDSTFDFNDVGAGAYNIYSAAYTGSITAKINENLKEVAFSNDCYHITDAPIRIIRDNPYAGEMKSSQGLTKVYTCPENDDLDFVRFDPVNAIYLNYAFIVTDTLDVIISFSFVDSIDFGLADPGKCRVYGVSYEGNFTARIGNQLRNIAFSDECWDLSTNFVEINRTTVPDAFTFEWSTGDSIVTVCSGDGGLDALTFIDNDPIGVPKAYVIADTNNIILDYTISSSYDFTDTIAGVNRIFSVAYTGNFSAPIGSDVFNSTYGDDCFTLADNFVLVNRVTEGPLCLVSNHPVEENQQVFRIYPNPTSHRFMLEVLPQGITQGITYYTLNNLQGQTLQTGEIRERQTIHLDNLTPQMLVLKVYNNFGKTWVEKIIVQ